MAAFDDDLFTGRSPRVRKTYARRGSKSSSSQKRRKADYEADDAWAMALSPRPTRKAVKSLLLRPKSESLSPAPPSRKQAPLSSRSRRYQAREMAKMKERGSEPGPHPNECEKKPLEGLSFLLTGFDTADLATFEDKVEKLGGSIAETINDGSPLVLAQRCVRTRKVLYGLARGLLPLSLVWLKDCAEAGALVEGRERHVHRVPGTSTRLMTSVIARNCMQPLPEDARALREIVLLLPRDLEEWGGIATEAGATVIKISPPSEYMLDCKGKKRFVALIGPDTDEDISELVAAEKVIGAEILLVQWLIDSLASQEAQASHDKYRPL